MFKKAWQKFTGTFKRIKLPVIDFEKWTRVTLVFVLSLLCLYFVFSGVRVIQQGEVGVVLRFGKLWGMENGVKQPGLLIAFPHPIDEVIRVPSPVVVKELVIEDFWQPDEAGASASRSFHPLEQGYCITGDYNVVVTKLTAKYQINDAVNYALFVENPEDFLKQTVAVELISTVGELGVDFILTQGKAHLANEVMRRTQTRMDAIENSVTGTYGTGIVILSIEINEMIPPRNILPQFLDVQNAAIDKETSIRFAEAARARMIPAAEAGATEKLNNARAYSLVTISVAEGDSARFNDLLNEYRQYPEVVRARLLHLTLSRVMENVGERYIVPDVTSGGRLLIPLEGNTRERTGVTDYEDLMNLLPPPTLPE